MNTAWWNPPFERGERVNNFDALRILAAALVLFSHSFDLFGPRPEPIAALTGYTTGGGLAIATFFFMSGFLLTASLLKNGHLLSYVAARELRILPGLAGAVLVTIFVIGPLMTRLPIEQYFTSPATWLYLKNALVFPLHDRLPGVFESLPYGGIVNGSLWTLPIEVTMYGLLPFLLRTGALGRARAFLVPVAFFAALMVARVRYGLHFGNQGPFVLWSVSLYSSLELGMFFTIGSSVAIYRDRIPVDGRLALGCLFAFVATCHTPFGYAGQLIAVPYLTYYLAWCSIPLRRLTTWSGDISYGFYIYAFPVQQSVFELTHDRLGFWSMMGVSFIVTLALAWLSWRLIERPALSLKPGVVARLRERYPTVAPAGVGAQH